MDSNKTKLLSDDAASKAVVPYVRPPHVAFNIIPPPPQKVIVGNFGIPSPFSIWRQLLSNQQPSNFHFGSHQEDKPLFEVLEKKDSETNYETDAITQKFSESNAENLSPKETGTLTKLLKKQVSIVLPALEIPNESFSQDEEKCSPKFSCHDSPFCASQMYNCALQEEEPEVPAKKSRSVDALVADFSTLTQVYVVGLEDAAYDDDDDYYQTTTMPSNKSPLSIGSILSNRPKIVVWPWQSQQSEEKEPEKPATSNENEQGPQKPVPSIDSDDNLKKPVPPEIAVFRDFKPPSRIIPQEKPFVKTSKQPPKNVEEEEEDDTGTQSEPQSQQSNYCPFAQLPKLPRVAPGRQRRVGLQRRNAPKHF